MSELSNCKCGAPAMFSTEYQDCDGNPAVECTVCNMLSWTVEDWNRRPDPAPVGVRVPDAIDAEPVNTQHYADGWNDCRDETLRLNPQPGAAVDVDDFVVRLYEELADKPIAVSRELEDMVRTLTNTDKGAESE